MSTTTIDLGEWLACLQDVLRDYAAKHLRFEAATAASPAPSTGPQPAAYVAIVGNDGSMYLGLASSMEGCRTLARAFLGLRQRDPLTDREAGDGMSEILNILAGKVKSRMTARDGSLRLGLPMFVMGPVGHAERTDRLEADAKVGPVPCRLHVIRQQHAS
ncbi:MAG: chemotaxis protein CheX [Hyphomicrobiales bacterium]